MNVGRARSLVIIFFVILNVMLFALNLEQRSRYKITTKQETAIFKVLNQNNIDFYDYLVKDFSPMKQIDLTSYDHMKMFRVCFDYSEEVKKSTEFEKTLIESTAKGSKKTLTIYTKDKSGFLFDNPDGTGKIELTEESAEAACEDFIKQLNDDSLNLKLDFTSKNDDGYYTLEYRSVFNKYTIYSSYARFKVTERGVVQLRGDFYIANEFAENTREIYSSDEALYSLIHEIKNIYGDKGELIKIDGMDVVYKTEEAVTEANVAVKADPYYRVYVSARSEQPFLINAYTNVVVK